MFINIGFFRNRFTLQTVETLRKVFVFVGVALLLVLLTTPTALLSTLKSVSFVSQSTDDVTGYLSNLLRRVREFSPKMSELLFAYLPTMLLVAINTLMMYVWQDRLGGKIVGPTSNRMTIVCMIATSNQFS